VNRDDAVTAVAEAASAVEGQHRHMTSGTPGVWRCTGCEWQDGATQFDRHLRLEVAATAVAALEPYIAARIAAETEALRREVERLTRWKAEAMEVLSGWEAVYEDLGSPGNLGDRKHEAVRCEVAKYTAIARQAVDAGARAEAERNEARAALARVEALCDEADSCDANDSDIAWDGWIDSGAVRRAITGEA